MSEQAQGKVGWLTWLRWVWPAVLGWLLIGISSTVLDPAEAPASYGAALIVMAAILAGSAALQWLILRPRQVIGWHWIVASCAGFLLGNVIAFPLKLEDWYLMHSRFQMDEVAFGVVSGLVLGIAQWLALRGRLQGSAWWILWSAAAWGLGAAVGELLPLNWTRPAAVTIYLLVVGFVAAAVSGFALLFLLGDSSITGLKRQSLGKA
jgi:hypothetical protein